MPSVLAMASSKVISPSRFSSSMDCAREMGRPGASLAMLANGKMSEQKGL